mmetsp:Transcript_43290/g.85076  ORF Transcript_43290/g.85076 Transcript_43290/m.85076 type:complete len:249 (-) Transcript_43290:1842-2588(-)
MLFSAPSSVPILLAALAVGTGAGTSTARSGGCSTFWMLFLAPSPVLIFWAVLAVGTVAGAGASVAQSGEDDGPAGVSPPGWVFSRTGFSAPTPTPPSVPIFWTVSAVGTGTGIFAAQSGGGDGTVSLSPPDGAFISWMFLLLPAPGSLFFTVAAAAVGAGASAARSGGDGLSGPSASCRAFSCTVLSAPSPALTCPVSPRPLALPDGGGGLDAGAFPSTALPSCTFPSPASFSSHMASLALGSNRVAP